MSLPISNRLSVFPFLLVLLAFGGIELPCSNAVANQTVEEDRPNIVFLLTDDQATISMGCYGNPDVKTPCLDQLAADGVRFNRHYVTTAICMASRANIMTGLYEFRTGCNFEYGKMTNKHWKNSYPMLLRKAGYRTAFAGKFGFQVDGLEARLKGLPEDDFDQWGGGPGQTSYQTAKNKSMSEYAKDYPHSTLSYGEFSKRFIRTSVSEKKPFCLSISFKASHRPVTPDPKFKDIYKDTVFKKPSNYGRENGQHLSAQSKTGRQYPRFEEWGYSNNYNEVMKKYNQQIYAVDVVVGQIRDELQKLDVANNTIIIFTADNGFLCGSHGYGSKVIPYEESTRVPLIVFNPKMPSQANFVSDALTGSIDLAPTILEYAGVEPPKGIDGVSLVPVVADRNAEVRKSLAIMNFWGPKSANSFGVVTKKWKYIYWYSQENDMVATEELFDMGLDRSESVNVAGEEISDTNLAELNRMRELYDKHLYEVKDKAINSDYGKYKDLFDRKQSWESKKAILEGQK
ncbi:MAG: sulfatase [Mariniblastus sp.]